MSLPAVSIVCPTYGRTRFLVEVVESFKRQDYAGPLELLIVSDCPDQTLVCNVPGVRLWNAQPFANFGTKMHLAIGATSAELLLRWDDDDLYLPSLVTSLVQKLQREEAIDGREHRCAKLRSMFQWKGGDSLCRVSANHQHTLLFRRSAYQESGGYQPLEAGRADREFWGRIAPRWFSGRWFHEPDGCWQAIHRADPGRPHMEGSDPPPISERQFQALAAARMRSGEEPTGVVVLEPSWSRDWLAMANAAPTQCPCESVS